MTLLSNVDLDSRSSIVALPHRGKPPDERNDLKSCSLLHSAQFAVALWPSEYELHKGRIDAPPAAAHPAAVRPNGRARSSTANVRSSFRHGQKIFVPEHKIGLILA